MSILRLSYGCKVIKDSFFIEINTKSKEIWTYKQHRCICIANEQALGLKMCAHALQITQNNLAISVF